MYLGYYYLDDIEKFLDFEFFFEIFKVKLEKYYRFWIINVVMFVFF